MRLPVALCYLLLSKSLVSLFPVIIVEDWSEVTEELLQKTLVDFSTRRFNYDKLTSQYWINQIKNN